MSSELLEGHKNGKRRFKYAALIAIGILVVGICLIISRSYNRNKQVIYHPPLMGR
jgi:hypothetical protein